MVNLFPLTNDEAYIADLRKRHDAHIEAARLIAQAIASLEAIHGLGGMSSEPKIPSPPTVMPSQVSTKPIHKGKLLPVAVKEEAVKVVQEITGDITQPLILRTLLNRFPGSEQVAKDKQWSARIAGVLRMLVEKGYLHKTQQSHSNNPSVYRKVSEMNEQEKAIAAETETLK